MSTLAAPHREPESPPPAAAMLAAEEDLRWSRTGVIVKIVVAAFLAAALILYLSWRRTASEKGPVSDPRTAVGKAAAAHREPGKSSWILDFDRL